MNRKLCIGLAEKIVAAKNEVEQKADKLRQKKAMLKKDLFIATDTRPKGVEDPFSLHFYSPYDHPKRSWEHVFSLTPEMKAQLKEMLIDPYEKALAEAQQKLDMLLEGAQ